MESPAAVTYVRKRVYAKRGAKSKRHWVRMDKKYAKRFGLRAEPAAYIIDDGFGGQVLIAHPTLAPQYRAAINNAFKPAQPWENRL